MRDKVVETGPKSDGGHQHDESEHRTEDGRTDRDGVSTVAGLEGEAEAGHYRDWQSRVRRQANGATFLLPSLTEHRGAESAQLPPGKDHGERTENNDEGYEPEPEHCPAIRSR